jgi:phage gp36-like protein
MGEGYQPSGVGYIESLVETLKSMKTSSQLQERRRQVALENAAKARREYLRMERKMKVLQERLQVLEENKND